MTKTYSWLLEVSKISFWESKKSHLTKQEIPASLTNGFLRTFELFFTALLKFGFILPEKYELADVSHVGQDRFEYVAALPNFSSVHSALHDNDYKLRDSESQSHVLFLIGLLKSVDKTKTLYFLFFADLFCPELTSSQKRIEHPSFHHTVAAQLIFLFKFSCTTDKVSPVP